jgi:type I restriction enzyme R subunit
MATPTEARTRKELIDPALKKAGWDVDNHDLVGTEIPVDEFEPQAWRALEAKLRRLGETGVVYDVELPKGVSDYVLYRPDGDIIAVVEAKRTSIDPRLAQVQTEFYVQEIAKRQGFAPFAFMTNGYRIEFWDVGRANPRQVAGFFSPDDLRNLLYIRQNQTPLTDISINLEITDRPYQLEAMQRLCDAFENKKKRKALLVMATGTGKTRVAMSLADIFMRANQARKILFVADRDALVRQALTEGFEAFLPDEPCARIFSHNTHKIKANRLFVVTLQTLSNCYQDFTPAFFDLITFDEVHRSIFNKWNEVIHYFDGCMIGLTATPAQYIDRNTFLEFDCTDEVPTFLYSRQEAEDEGYLVGYELYTARTKFQRKGIRGVDLSEEEKQVLIDQGYDPDAIDFSGTDLERTVTNKGTLRKQWEEIWDVCLKDQSGQLPGKTIVFAMTQAHALRLLEVFNEMFPQYPDLARVITYKSEHKGTAIKTFKRESLPRIAISVDMLETGVNVPEAVNLVFMRPVHSPIKLEQMIGRGTRNNDACSHPAWLPNGKKEKFLIIDLWENDFEKREHTEESPTTPVLIKLFNTRLDLLECYLDDQQSAEAQQMVADLRVQIAEIPQDTYSVKKVYPEVERAWQDTYWLYLTQNKLDFLRRSVGPLLRFAPMGDVQAVTFTTKVERLKLERETGQDTNATARSIAEDVSHLPDFVYEDPDRAQAARLCQSPQDLQSATVDQLKRIIEALADQMKNRRKEETLVKLDLGDVIELRSYIILDEKGEPVYAQEYRERVQRKVMDLLQYNPTLAALARGEAVSDPELLKLERALRQELGTPDIQLTPGNIHRAYAVRVGCLLEFLRQLLELEDVPDYADIIRRQFQDFIAAHAFNANQILFLRTLQSVLAQKHRVTWADLYAQPFTNLGADAIDRWFTDDEASEIMAFAETLAIGG